MKYIQLNRIIEAPLATSPYPHLVANDVLKSDSIPALKGDFPEIKKAGFLPLNLLNRKGEFDKLLQELEGPELAEVLTEKLGVELRDKPRMITIRKWSALKDGAIHNDGEAKIVTSLIYLNDNWSDKEEGGKFRVLSSDKSFEDTVTEVAPNYGTFVCFVRTDNSWHGHKPFEGERRVIQITWLRSWEDFKRKNKRGKLALLIKKLFYKSYDY